MAKSSRQKPFRPVPPSEVHPLDPIGPLLRYLAGPPDLKARKRRDVDQGEIPST